MKNETILKKSIEKAVKNGFDYDYGGFRGVEELVNGNWDFPGGFYYSVIFSHSFAKAFWGEEWEITNAGYPFSFKSIGKYLRR